MPGQIPVTPVPLLLETYAQHDGVFEKLELLQRFPALPRGSIANRAPQVTDWPGQYRAMPVAIDLTSMLYLSIMKIKSLKRYLAEMAQKAEAIEQVNKSHLRVEQMRA